MTSLLASDLNLLIEKTMKKLSVVDYEIDVSGNTGKGEGFVGEVTFVKVHVPETKKTYSFIVKTAKTNKELRKKTPIKDAYDREAFMYNKVFPVLKELQVEKNVEAPFKSIAKCYLATTDDGKETIILENLKTLGYEMWPKETPQNLNHALMVFKEYGKFHALSMALRDQKPQVFKALTKDKNNLMGAFLKSGNMLAGYQRVFENVMGLLRKNGFEHLVHKFDGIKGGIESILMDLGKSEPQIICHGDCWNNNMMFKYSGQDRSKPSEMCFLDFQLSYASSPAIDLSYYFYTTCDKNTIKSFDFLLQAYYSSLTDFLAKLGSNVEELLTLETLKEHWKKYGAFGLLMATFIVKIELCSPEDAPDIETSAEKDDFTDFFNIKLQNQGAYDKRMIDVFVHFSEKFL